MCRSFCITSAGQQFSWLQPSQGDKAARPLTLKVRARRPPKPAWSGIVRPASGYPTRNHKKHWQQTLRAKHLDLIDQTPLARRSPSGCGPSSPSTARRWPRTVELLPNPAWCRSAGATARSIPRDSLKATLPGTLLGTPSRRPRRTSVQWFTLAWPAGDSVPVFGLWAVKQLVQGGRRQGAAHPAHQLLVAGFGQSNLYPIWHGAETQAQ